MRSAVTSMCLLGSSPDCDHSITAGNAAVSSLTRSVSSRFLLGYATSLSLPCFRSPAKIERSYWKEAGRLVAFIPDWSSWMIALSHPRWYDSKLTPCLPHGNLNSSFLGEEEEEGEGSRLWDRCPRSVRECLDTLSLPLNEWLLLR